MEIRNEIQGEVTGQFQVNNKKYFIFELTSEDKARFLDININIGSIIKISGF